LKENWQSVRRYRLQQAEEAVKDARILYDGGGSFFSVVNRSYYAVFYAVLALFSREDHEISAHSHGEMLLLFDREYVETNVFSEEVSGVYHRVFDLRKECDYREFNSVTEEEVLEVMSDAVEFVRMMQSHLKDVEKQERISRLQHLLEVIRGKFSTENFASREVEEVEEVE